MPTSDGLNPAFVDSSMNPFMLDSSQSPQNLCNFESKSQTCWLGLESESESNILFKNESFFCASSLSLQTGLKSVLNRFQTSFKVTDTQGLVKSMIVYLRVYIVPNVAYINHNTK